MPKIIPRSEHNISRKFISENALKVLNRLNNNGYEAYLVGGCVRDLLLNKTPKDFDITTNATPEQIQKTFKNCRLVGRRFRLAHILFGKEIIEVATFRGNHEPKKEDKSNSLSNNLSKHSQSGMLLRDNVYGTLEQDAIRRDFSMNSLYYSIKDFTIRDFCNGIEDLKNGVIRLIGDPTVRYQEDPVRMLRAIRFSAKLSMTIEKETAKPIKKLAPLLNNIPSARLFDESLKLLQTGYGYSSFLLLKQYHIFSILFPNVAHSLPNHSKNNDVTNVEKMVVQTLKNTDYRIQNNQRVNPAFLFAAMLWYPLSEQTQTLILESGLSYHDAFDLAMNDILTEQCSKIAIPKRLTAIMSDIWRLQLRFNKRTVKRVNAVFAHNKFRAGYDLLELRSSIEKGELLELATWWDQYQYSDSEKKLLLIKQLNKLEKKYYNKTRKSKYHRNKTINQKNNETDL